MSLFERGLQVPAVGMGELLSGRRAPIEGETAVDLPAYTDEILRSGFPAIRVLPARARRAQLDGYLARIVEHLGPDLLDAALITTGTHAYRRADGIAVIPAALLGP